MKRAIFTIVAKNYIGLAQILGQSIRHHHEEVNFFIFVADEFDTHTEDLGENIIMAKDTLEYSQQEWMDMAFKYDLTEFCTAIKPACFQYLFARQYHQTVYLDPDIYMFSPMTAVWDKLEDFDVVLTPQIAGIHIDYQGEHPEWAMNVNGIFNLGFCGMRNTETAHTVLDWWRQRLLDNAFMDRSVGNFTDQKWMDWMPGFLGNEHLYVFHHLGMNMAPWNFFERELFIKEGGGIMVRYRTDDNPYREDPLIFLHFAGYDYQKMKNGIIERKRIENLQEYKDLSLATQIYCRSIVDNQATFDRYITNTYSYATYDNGDRIASFHRRLYHGMKEIGQHVANPFATGPRSFHSMLQGKGMIIAENTDKLSQRNISNIDKKRKQIGKLFSLLYKVMGYKRYMLFVKSLYNYCRPELHTFLIHKDSH